MLFCYVIDCDEKKIYPILLDFVIIVCSRFQITFYNLNC